MAAIDIDTTDTSNPNIGRNQWILGLVNSAPYVRILINFKYAGAYDPTQLCCAVLGCWVTDPLNKIFGRRGTIFITATLSFLTCIWQGVTNSWEHLFVARLVLGLGIGPKSATVPVYAAECTPTPIRGALVMMWQMWTAFGIMLGYVSDIIFLNVSDPPHITGLNWRLMLASAGMPALIVMAQVWYCPESPRWLMSKGRFADAYHSLARLRSHPILAARDLYCRYPRLPTRRFLKVDSTQYRHSCLARGRGEPQPWSPSHRALHHPA